MSQSWNRCRFCGETSFNSDDEMVKYGVRHYAHFKCYLDAGKTLSALHDWQIGKFPYRLLQDRGLLAEAEPIVKKLEARHDQFMAKART